MPRMLTALFVTLTFARALFAGDPVPDAQTNWSIQLQGCFHDGKDPMYLYGRESKGRWLAAIVSTRRSYNTVYHAVDLSKLPIRDGKIKGVITITILPDEWVPSNHESFPMAVELDAKVSDPGAMAGTWKIISIDSTDSTIDRFGKSGRIVGAGEPISTPPLPSKLTFDLNLANSVVGGDPKYGPHSTSLEVACEDGRCVSASWAFLGARNTRTGVTPLPIEANAVRYDRFSLRGKCSFPGKTMDGQDANYVVDFDGSIVKEMVTGVYTARITAAGKPPVVRHAGFEGRWSAGSEKSITDTRPWWALVKDFHDVRPGEHPRMLFRRSDLPMLRQRAGSPEGQAILARLRRTLDGKNGDTMPVAYNPEVGPVDHDGAGAFAATAPLGSFTIGHVAGYGLLYQLTGEKKYADLGRQCFEKSMEGYRDVDCRYSFQGPQNPFRGGTALAWMAVGFDLCYDGWDEATRRKVAGAIADYRGVLNTKGESISLEALVYGTMPPFSNHFGAQVGGGAMALLAVLDEPGVDQVRIKKLLAGSEISMARNLSEGFGDGGFFAEGDGTGSISSQLSFLPALQAWKSVLGRDYVNVDRPNARMLTLKWIYQTVVRGGKPDFWPVRGAYPHNVWERGDKSGAGYFAIGFANVTDDQKAAMRWYYDKFLLAPDTKDGCPFDTVSRYPHLSVCAFVNWPFALAERNPAEVLPLCYRDSIRGFYAWRNRWKDEDDIVISTLLSQTEGYMKARSDGNLAIAAFGKKLGWGKIGGASRYWWASRRGSTSVLTVQDGTTLAVDFTKASGVDALLVTSKIDADNRVDQQVKLGDVTLYFLFLNADGRKPVVAVESGKAVVGKQTISLKDGNISFGVTEP